MFSSPAQTPRQADYKFIGRTNSVVSILKALNVVHSHKDVHATFIIRDTSITVTVEEMRCVQANAYITSECFQEYALKDSSEVAAFRVNLSDVVSFLKVGSTNENYMKMSYLGDGFDLELLVEDNGMITDCKLKTMPPDDLVQFSALDRAVHNRITMHCDVMQAIVRELDPSSEFVDVGMSAASPNLSLHTSGSAGVGSLEINEADGVFRSINCSFTTRATFKSSHLRMVFKPLGAFNIFCIKLDDEGLLRVQYQTTTQAMRHILAEFYLMPQVDDVD